LLAILAGDAGRRHVEIAREVEAHSSVQNAARGCDLIVSVGSSDSLEYLIEGIRIGKDVYLA
jgi:hypothetical protein